MKIANIRLREHGNKIENTKRKLPALSPFLFFVKNHCSFSIDKSHLLQAERRKAVQNLRILFNSKLTKKNAEKLLDFFFEFN